MPRFLGPAVRFVSAKPWSVPELRAASPGGDRVDLGVEFPSSHPAARRAVGPGGNSSAAREEPGWRERQQLQTQDE